MKHSITNMLLSALLILSILPATLADNNPENNFNINYDMDLSIYSEPRWLDEHLSWTNDAHAKITNAGTDANGNPKVRVAFEDWSDNSFDDVIFEVSANNNLITIHRVSHNTAAPDPTTLTLQFAQGTFLRVVEEERTYSGQDITIRLWDDVRQGESTRTILIPRMINGVCDAGTFAQGDTCVLSDNPDTNTSDPEEPTNPVLGDNEYWLHVGESVIVNNKILTLNNVGSGGNVQVTTGGITKVLDYQEITSINGLDIEPRKYYFVSTPFTNRWSVLHITKTQTPNPVNNTVLDVSVRDVRIVPEQPKKGDSISVFADVRNEGTQALDIYAYSILYETGTNSIVEKSSKVISRLPANSGSSVFTLNHQLNKVIPGKSYYVKVYAGYVNDIPESNFNNNEYVKYFTVQSESLPDLVGYDLNYVNNYDSNVYMFTAQVKNTGAMKSGPFVIQFLDNGVVRDTKTIASIESYSTAIMTFTPLALSYGYHNVVLSIDPYNSVQESNEYNNKDVSRQLNVEVTNHYENRPTVTLTPIKNTVEDGEVGSFRLVIQDNHKNSLTKNAYKYTLEKGIPYATDLPGFVWVNAGEKKTITFNVYTSSPILGTEYAIGTSGGSEVEYSKGISSGSSSSVRSTTRYDSKPYSIRVSVIPEQPQYRVSVFSTLYVIEDLNPPKPPVIPGSDYVSIELEEGWNLVSIPGTLVSFQSNKCSRKPVAFVYIDSKEKYVTMQEAQKILGGSFKEYVSEHSFWVYSYNECTMNVRVNSNVEHDLSVAKGWNFLPVKNSMIGKDLDDLTGNRDVIAYFYDENAQSWSRFYTVESFTTSHIGRGIVLRANKAFTIKLDSNTPPELPDDVLVPEVCQIGSPFSCQDFELDDGVLKLELKNHHNQMISAVVYVNGVSDSTQDWDAGDTHDFEFAIGKSSFDGTFRIDWEDDFQRTEEGILRVND